MLCSYIIYLSEYEHNRYNQHLVVHHCEFTNNSYNYKNFLDTFSPSATKFWSLVTDISLGNFSNFFMLLQFVSVFWIVY